MTNNFNVLLRDAYESSRDRAQSRVPAQDLGAGAADVRTAALFAGATIAEAEEIGRRHAAQARKGDPASFNAHLRAQYAAAVGRRPRP